MPVNESTPDKRRRLRQHWAECARLIAYYEENVVDHCLRRYPSFPDDLRGLTCGAISKRTGKPCKSLSLYTNGRCKFHGGASTGPTTEAGKLKSAQNGKAGGRPRKAKSMAG